VTAVEGLKALQLAGALFLAGAILAAIGSIAQPAATKRLWTAYALEFLTVSLILGPAYVGPWALLPVMGVVLAIAGWELTVVLRHAETRPVTPLPLLVGASLLLIAAALPNWFYPAFTVALLVTFSVCLVIRSGDAHSATSGTVLVILIPWFLGSHILLLEGLPGGFGHLFFVYAIVEVNDAFAFLIGSLLGRHPLWPKVSPSKTIEGSIGGLLAAVASAAALCFAAPELSIEARVLLALLLGVFTQAGDLWASAAKRQAGVKDFGRLVPGQGGVLDVYDSLIFTAPLFYVALLVVHAVR
jgi:phosphatidate cytidylyltransferase